MVDDAQDAVFVYDVSGTYLGHWTIDPANTDPSGITRSLTDASLLWVVDRVDKQVYQYGGGTNKLSGSKTASKSFALISKIQHPEGIADPYGYNYPPTAYDDTVNDVQIGVATDIYVLANDTDPENDPLTVVSTTTPSYGTVQISADGQYVTYTAGTGFGEGSGDSSSSGSADDSFQYTISDGNGNTSTAYVYLYAPANYAPTAYDDDVYDVVAGQTVNVYVLSNDTDPESDPLSVTGVTSPSYGTATVSADGQHVIYTAGSGFGSGSSSSGPADYFQYSISDGNGNSATATVYVYALPNYAPTANDDNVYNVEPNTSVTVLVLANDTDPEDDPLTITSVTTPSYGTATISADGKTVMYAAGSGFGSGSSSGSGGGDYFQYTISDGQGNSATATVWVHPAPNDPPQAYEDTVHNVRTGVPVEVSALRNDFDSDGDLLTITSITTPSYGTAEISPDGKYISYTAGTGFGTGSGSSSGSSYGADDYLEYRSWTSAATARWRPSGCTSGTTTGSTSSPASTTGTSRARGPSAGRRPWSWPRGWRPISR